VEAKQVDTLLKDMHSCNSAIVSLTDKVDLMHEEIKQERLEQHTFNVAVEGRVRIVENKCVAPELCKDHEDRIRSNEKSGVQVDALVLNEGRVTGLRKQLVLIVIASIVAATAAIAVPRVFNINTTSAPNSEVAE